MDMTPSPDRWFENGLDLSAAETRLRRPTIQDQEAVLRVFCDAPDVTRFVAWQPMRTIAEAREFLGLVISGWRDARPAWFVEDVKSGQVVGSIIAVCEVSEVELSFVIAPAWWGRGHATTAVRMIAEGAFTDPAVQRIRAYCDAENDASARVLEKAGFTLEDRLAAHGVHNVSPEPRDCFCYVRERA